MIKTLHKFMLRSYLGPFVMTFFIAVFIFFMIFLFKYIDDIVGKGLEFSVLAKLFFYAAVTTVPSALPLAILLSSIMTFGNLGEHYELVALKSTGLSLHKIMAPLTLTAILLSGCAFYFSNTILPLANLKMGALLFDVRSSKPTLNFKEGVFYNGIEGYSIRIGNKLEDGKSLERIMIYDHTKFQGNNKVIFAKSGQMEMSADKKFLHVKLEDGYSYEELMDTPEQRAKHSMVRTHFKEQNIRFDLSSFKLNRTNEELFKSNYQMLNLNQLKVAIDSLKNEKTRDLNSLQDQINKNLYFKSYAKQTNILTGEIAKAPQTNTIQDSIQNKKIEKQLLPVELSQANSKVSRLSQLSEDDYKRVTEGALNLVRTSKAITENTTEDLDITQRLLNRHEAEWHKKFTLSFACLVLFFIGAPLGAIIRKGGLGLPVVFSVIFFILFHVLSITGEKFVKEGVAPAYQGMWLASLVFLPLGIFLTYKATSDSDLVNLENYFKPFKKIFAKFKG